MILSKLGDLATEELKGVINEKTEEIIQSYLEKWAIQLTQWLSKANFIINNLNYVKNKLQKTIDAQAYFNQFLKFFDVNMLDDQLMIGIAQQNKILQESSIILEQAQALLIEGYKILNLIGETFRGEKINYVITVTSSGSKIGIAAEGQADIYTFVVSFEQFLKIASNFGAWEAYLKRPTTILKQAENENIKMYQWTQEDKDNFILFCKQVHGITFRKGKKTESPWAGVNEGNLLEAFFRFEGTLHSPVADNDHGYWIKLVQIMRATMSAPANFSQGGDIANSQIKGIKASITNLGTLINISTKLLSTLLFNKKVSQNETIQKYLQSDVKPMINRHANDTVENTVDQLKKLLTDSIDRTTIINLT